MRAEPARLSVLMLGDDGHHRPADLAKLITPVLAKDGIDVTYTEDVEALTPERLAKCDALLIFRDHGDLPPKPEAALMDFVEGGKGLFALHCASNCFRNSDKYTALVGGRFLRHNTGDVPGPHHRRPAPGHARSRAVSRAGTRPTSTTSSARTSAC